MAPSGSPQSKIGERCCYNSRPHRHRTRDSQALYPNVWLPDERVRLGPNRRRASSRRRACVDRSARRRRRHSLQHVLGARKGAGARIPRPRPGARIEGHASRPHTRCRRLRGEPGGHGDRPARALRRRRIRSADAAPLARAPRAAPRERHAPGRHQLPADREVRSPARAACGRGARLRLHHGRLQQVLQFLRRALHARRRSLAAVRRCRGGDRCVAPAGRKGSDPPRPERERVALAHWRADRRLCRATAFRLRAAGRAHCDGRRA